LSGPQRERELEIKKVKANGAQARNGKGAKTFVKAGNKEERRSEAKSKG
jgi:hypothetical protein